MATLTDATNRGLDIMIGHRVIVAWALTNTGLWSLIELVEVVVYRMGRERFA